MEYTVINKVTNDYYIGSRKDLIKYFVEFTISKTSNTGLKKMRPGWYIDFKVINAKPHRLYKPLSLYANLNKVEESFINDMFSDLKKSDLWEVYKKIL